MGLVWLLSTLGLLAVSVSADLALFQQRAPMMPERVNNLCFNWQTKKSPKLLSLNPSSKTAHHSNTLEIHIEGADSFQSEFDLRTLDPEGVVFYGDMNGGDNWFVLALRDGRPEIQISNEYCNIAVQAGDQLSDGRWRRVMVRSGKSNIQMLVDQRPSLTITILPNVGLEGNLVKLRIAVGNLLINESKLLIPLKHRLDACISNWDWLQQNTSWLDKKVSGNPNIQCPANIMPGTFFQGVGMAVFKTSGFRNGSESVGDWVMRFEGVLRPTKHSGMVLAVLSENYHPLLRLDFVLEGRVEMFRLSLGATRLMDLLPTGHFCQGQALSLTVSAQEATLAIGDQQRSQPLQHGLFAPLHNAWFHTDALLCLGGLPALESLGHDWSLYRGCMQGLKLQQKPVDFNQAYFVDNSISTHSCPAPRV